MASSFQSAILTVLFSKVSILALSVLFTPLLVRLLGPTLYGQYAIILSVFAITAIFMMSGTTEAVRKYVSEQDDVEWQVAVIKQTYQPAFLIGILAAVAFALLAWSGVVATLFGEAFTPLFYLLSAYAIGRQLRVHILWTLMGLQLESWSEPLKVVQKVVFVVLALTLVYIGYGVAGVLIADIITSVMTVLIGGVLIGRHLPLTAFRNPPTVDLPIKQIRKYAVSTVIFYLFLMSLYHVDVLLLQIWVADRTVGYYKGALVIAEVLWVAPLAVQLALLQRVSSLWESGDIETIEVRAQRVTYYVLLLTSLLALGVGALAFDVVPLYLGESFTPAIVPLILLLPGVLGFAVARPSLAINQARRSLRPLLLATGASSVLNVLLNLLLIPRYGMAGAAIATSIGYGSLVVFQSAIARDLGYQPLGGIRWGPTLASVTVTAAVIVPLSVIITSPVLSLLIVPPIGALVFTVCIFGLGAITFDELQSLVDTVGVLPTRLERGLLVTVKRVTDLSK
ncbi:lipopolysaccharide biosynthesis protein [Natronosalvus amylolyticus]|uniref:lipopolysaccharide biosynthesis protein n=1 Tax=Natronosalvus amylolyticus TaxID=2961994 RepID=UPI0020C952A4|nr:polysaccharide biosynthesis C-terminal domain-containing protein [Natronosalvus amylolyticus]